MNRLKAYWYLFVLVVIVACAKSNEEDLRSDPNNGGTGSCNTANMSFATDIVPILQTNCYACHSNANQAISGISLEGYANVKVVADDGRLVGTISHANGYPPMPQTGAKLSDCTINKVKSWVTSGSPNN